MTTVNEEINTLRRRAFALAKTAGFDGGDATEFLRQRAGVASLGGMDVTGWRALVATLARRTPTEVMAAPAGCTTAQWKKLMVLKRALKYSDATFRQEIKRIAKVDHERFLDVPRTRAVIAGLEQTYRYREAKAARPAKDRQRPKRLPREERP